MTAAWLPDGVSVRIADTPLAAVTTGADALDLCRTEKFDLALIDLEPNARYYIGAGVGNGQCHFPTQPPAAAGYHKNLVV